MARKVAFSSGHRYWIENLSAEANRDIFGQWASPYNHGHNYVLDVVVQGVVDPTTGMIVNIKRVDDILKAGVLKDLDQRSLNDEVPDLVGKSPTLENLLLMIRDRLWDLPAESRLVALRLEETASLYAELTLEPSEEMTLTRTYEFAASHRLHSPALSDEENIELFGKCNNPNGHGHNYMLEVTVSGEPHPTSGMLVDIGALDSAVKATILDRYDHKNLNLDLPEFKEKVTTSEVVASQIFESLKLVVPASLSRVRLWETARNMFEVSA